ncbi:MAG: ABC-F family ATP-binding cassette domain-containing protein [Anaerolineae bacterium]|jgi:ATP-binding cassette subfamily F protein 3|nr:ABC-F family ATP-binding cassette domain-containing protein [Anaerolineae bacterium]MBT4309482.1 ABC-F family ATP-binding cassette domain-containing protein [Anaerolineae bacterium]MBT4459472.1 ABC-F family ATP-binding cassette domain-containing protein [Anaerolineae bacterium]MBT4842396.1 ABC-F family ATP-binding cassette domain-containing protein [Anaerolineae bacterium]MBT6060441.1 ABC-F family ATP-binding cassette domain-containing protein [Anaerolineae bacterium]
MSLIIINNLTKSYGHVDIFSGLNFTIEHGSRLALVGPNGVGKTTLLRILIGEESASEGRVTKAKKLRIGYLPQAKDFQSDSTVWDECLAVFAEVRAQGEEMERLAEQMSDEASASQILARYGQIQAEFEHRGGYTYETRIRQVLSGLGFADSEFNMPIDHLSGGQRTRAYLAKLLLSEPDVLLLDEPTNHLDIAAVEWLEGYLSKWAGAVLIVSHDRYFLDHAANGILEMTAAGVETYRGNYSHYVGQRVERWERRQKVFKAEKEKLLKEAEYIKKHIEGQRVSQARGKLRRLSRIVQAIEQVGMDAVINRKWSAVSQDIHVATSDLSPDEAERRVRSLRLPDHRPPQLHLSLRAEKRSGVKVIRTKNLQVGFDTALFSAPDIELERKDCAALIGPNGAGKTTFIRTILGQIPPFDGEVNLGASLEIGYFDQAHGSLDEKNTLMQEIEKISPMLPGSVREYLGKFLFSGDDVFKQVSTLSGGERGRLALAKLALQDTNLLLLDEPTNHLDIPAQEIMQQVLDAYAGTILLVTHDRYLIDALATQIWEIGMDSARLSVYKGTYSQMRAERDKETERARIELATAKGTSSSARTSRRDPAQKEKRRKKARLQEVENQVAALESRLAELSKQLENPPKNPDTLRRLGEEYTQVQDDMDAMLVEWEELAE